MTDAAGSCEMMVQLEQTTWHGSSSSQREPKISRRISRIHAVTTINVIKLYTEVYKKTKIVTLFNNNVAAELSEHPAQTVVI